MKLWPFGLYRVSGKSMAPAYQPGDLLFGYRWGRPKPGRVVIIIRDGRPLLKRIVRLDGDSLWVEGDNLDHSTDSRNFGLISMRQVEAIAVKSRKAHVVNHHKRLRFKVRSG